VPLINQAFSPSDSDLEFYEGLIAAYQSAATKGEGALRYRGLHIDKAHYDKAVDWLAQAREQLDLNRSAD
jgi:citrate lyase subunit beta/citryl-CoA lyase